MVTGISYPHGAAVYLLIYSYSISESVALQLGNNRDFLNKLVKWCECDEHAGVQGRLSGIQDR